MHCLECDASVHAEAIFCHKCGHRVEADSEMLESEPRPNEQGTDSPEMPSTATPPPSAPLADDVRSQLLGGKQGNYEEEHLWTGGYSAKAMIGSSVAAAFLTVLLLVGAILLPSVNGWTWTIAIGMMLFLWSFLTVRLLYRRMNVRYELTTHRFIHQSGILRRVTDRIETIDIDDVNFEQGVFDRMVGVGTIRISSSDRSHPELVLLGIENVKEVAETIDIARRKERERRGLYIESI